MTIFQGFQKRFYFSLLIMLLLVFIPRLDSRIRADEIMTSYLVQDFESVVPQAMYDPWCGGARRESEIVHQGRHALRLSWYARGAKPSDPGYIRFELHFPVVGTPQKIRAWIYTPKEYLGCTVTFWIGNGSGPKVDSSTAVLQHEGWHEEEFTIPAEIAGQGSVRILSIRLGGGAGSDPYIVIDQMTIETTGQPRDLVDCQLRPSATDFATGPNLPEYCLSVQNYSQKPIDGLSLEVKVTDSASEVELLQKKLDLSDLTTGSRELKFTPDFKFGQFIQIAWTIGDKEGILSSISKTVNCTRLLADATVAGDQKALQNYSFKWGLPGGVFWQCTPQRGQQAGGAWIRLDSMWVVYEYAPGQYDFTAIRNHIAAFKEYGHESLFGSHFHIKPPFYEFNQLSFAPAYGRLNQAVAHDLQGEFRWYELANECNGPEKFIYTELARSAAAGIRSSDPLACIGTCGTAGVDIGWFQMQADRGLLHRLDSLVTHPYTWSAPPDQFGLLSQNETINRIIDEEGGMKFHYTTEFGYDHYVGLDKIARWLPRHFAIAAATDVLRAGLYAWDGHFGIYDNAHALPAAASVNAFCVLTQGHQFAGWLQRDDSVWALVFEKAGVPLVMAWSPADKGTLNLKNTGDKTIMLDLYGNVIPHKSDLEEGPYYYKNGSRKITHHAWQNQMVQGQQRLRKLLEKSPLKDGEVWKKLAASDGPSYAELVQALTTWQPQSNPISMPEQAVIAQMVRQTILAARMASLMDKKPQYDAEAGLRSREKWVEVLRKAVADDLDLNSLRWLLNQWDRLHDEAAMLAETGETNFAGWLGSLDGVFDTVCARFAEKGERMFFPIWPYLYASVNEAGVYGEHFQFMPDRPTPVYMRLNSYSSHAYEAEVSLELPADWKCEPADWKGRIEPGENPDGLFTVTPGVQKADKIYAVLKADGKPDVRVPYNDFAIIPAIRITALVQKTLLPAGPLEVELENRTGKPVSGILRIIPAADWPALATVKVKDVQPKAKRILSLRLPKDTAIPAYNEWNLHAHFLTEDGQSVLMPLVIDFDCVEKTDAPAVLDGDLAEWKAAAPLHMSQEAYTDGSFGTQWSPSDLSATVYSLWDADNLYLAILVNDQTFQQILEGESAWNQDSVQLGFAMEDKGKMAEFCLALTPKGPQVFQFGTGLLTDAKLTVKLLQGRTIYECAIPWTELNGIQPAVGTDCRFDILLNDHDAITSRRYMFRYGRGIVHEKNPNLFGYLRFVAVESQNQMSERTENDVKNIIFREDFEEYPDQAVPCLWQRVVHMMPDGNSVVSWGTGRNRSQGLVLENRTGQKDMHYISLVRKITRLETGKKYRLTVWVKGSDTTGIGICSDLWGNQGFQYLPAWKPSADWQKLEMEFSSFSENMNLIIRNETRIENLALDDIQIMEE